MRQIRMDGPSWEPPFLALCLACSRLGYCKLPQSTNRPSALHSCCGHGLGFFFGKLHSALRLICLHIVSFFPGPMWRKSGSASGNVLLFLGLVLARGDCLDVQVHKNWSYNSCCWEASEAGVHLVSSANRSGFFRLPAGGCAGGVRRCYLCFYYPGSGMKAFLGKGLMPLPRLFCGWNPLCAFGQPCLVSRCWRTCRDWQSVA